MKWIVGLVLLLASSAHAQIPTFTVDCLTTVIQEPGPGIWVVGKIEIVHPLGRPILIGVSCSSTPGSSDPIIPDDGIVCFCPNQEVESTCAVHADVSQPLTSSYCLQTPINNPTASTVASSAVFRHGRLRRVRPAR